MTANFNIDDKAVYPGHGVVQVVGLEPRDIAGKRRDFYILKVLDSDLKLMVPVDGAKRTGLRRVISRNQADKVVEVLRSQGIAVSPQPWYRRQREYTEMINSGSVFEVAKVLRDLHRLSGSKELSFSERRLRDQARSLLIAELTLANGYDISRVEEELEKALGPAGTNGR